MFNASPAASRTLRGVAIGATAAALLIVGVAGCSAQSPASSAANAVETSTHATTLEFVATDVDGNHVMEDLGDSNPGHPDIGDLIAFTQDLATDGTNVGQVHVSAIAVDHDRQLSEATATIVLEKGSIQMAGLVSMEPKFTLTVTGGTGDYVGATGTMAFDASGSDQTMKVELR